MYKVAGPDIYPETLSLKNKGKYVLYTARRLGVEV
jgi:hypothetical protein